MKHFKIIIKPENKQLIVHENSTILEAAAQAGVILNTPCGGMGTCRKCIVHISPDDRETLACQYKIKNELKVTIPRESRYFEPKILEYGLKSEKSASADIYEKYLQIAQKSEIFGIAIDIGTTTIVVKLINLADGMAIATESVLNPQSQYGDDVISRITYADSQERFDILRQVEIDCINEMIVLLCKTASINIEQVYEACIVGNTLMNHIFLGFPIKQLGYSPYQAYSLDAFDLTSQKTGLKINSAGNIHTVENIAGYVGSDITAVALATGIESQDKTTLIIDIGTNGEIILGTKEKLYAASCAAGPAFEGARIECGSRAVEGAIEAVYLNTDDIDLEVIGNFHAQSICGSGLIDITAVMLELEIIDRTGRFVDIQSLKDKLPPAVYNRLREYKEETAFYLTEKVFITQKDIRHIQLAKAAIQAGIKLLQSQLNIQNKEIAQVLLAGAFGNYIRRENACKIGLLPDVDIERVKFIGNAALSGAQMILLSQETREKAKKLAQKIHYIELANNTGFQDVYTDCMSF